MSLNLELQHTQLVSALAKPGGHILEDMNPEQANQVHMAIGVSGEAGELLDAIKKHTIYQKPLDRENVIEELGDIEFYLRGLRDSLGITRDETLEANIVKLQKRYHGGSYSNEQAQNRADKQQ